MKNFAVLAMVVVMVGQTLTTGSGPILTAIHQVLSEWSFPFFFLFILMLVGRSWMGRW